MFTRTRQRARKLGCAFQLTENDIAIPNVCPVLGIQLEHGTGPGGPKPNSPTLDKIIPELGYVPGNVCVISWRANRLKSDASVEELRRILAYVETGAR